jgi:DNA-binding transcriptional LysR family regulator
MPQGMHQSPEWNDRTRRRLKLREMDVLRTVIQSGSMGKAAAALNMSQPSISKAIGALEHTLGVPLLDRHRQGVEPTEYGRALLECGVAVFDALRQGVQSIESLADPTAGEVRIGCNPFLAATFASAIIDQLSQSHPRMVFHLVTAYGTTLYRELSERNVDFLIARRFRTFVDERMEFEVLFDDAYVVAAGVKNPWARRRRIALADLVNEPWVLRPAESVLGAVVADVFRASGLDLPRTTVVTDSSEVRMSLLATGRFLTILPASALRFPVRRPEFKVLPVRLPGSRVPSEIVTLKNRTLSPAAQLFIEHARAIAKPLRNKNDKRWTPKQT